MFQDGGIAYSLLHIHNCWTLLFPLSEFLGCGTKLVPGETTQASYLLDLKDDILLEAEQHGLVDVLTRDTTAPTTLRDTVGGLFGHPPTEAKVSGFKDPM